MKVSQSWKMLAYQEREKIFHRKQMKGEWLYLRQSGCRHVQNIPKIGNTMKSIVIMVRERMVYNGLYALWCLVFGSSCVMGLFPVSSMSSWTKGLSCLDSAAWISVCGPVEFGSITDDTLAGSQYKMSDALKAIEGLKTNLGLWWEVLGG